MKVIVYAREMNSSGGVEKYMYELFYTLKDRGFDFEFIIPSKNGNDNYYEKKIIENGGEITYIESHTKSVISNLKSLFKIIKKNKNCILHIHASDGYHSIVGLIARLSGCKSVILHSHNSSMIETNSMKISRVISKFSAHSYLGCTYDAGKYMFGNIVKTNKFSIAENSIISSRYKYNENIRRVIRSKYHIKEDEVLLGYVGRFSQEKNVLFTIEVLEKLHLSGVRNIRLMLVGDGEELESIKKYCQEIDITDKVIFTGVQSNVHEFMSAFDIFLLPSHFESFGIVLLEAQASGLKSIVSENVSRDPNITDLIHYVSLDVNRWCLEVLNVISEIKKIDRYYYSELVSKSKYEHTNSIEKIIELYNEISY